MEKKSKLLSWFRKPGFIQKNSNTSKTTESKNAVTKFPFPASVCTVDISQLPRTINGEILVPVQYCCHCVQQKEVLNTYHPISGCYNSGKTKHKNYTLRNDNEKYEELTHYHIPKCNTENKENLPDRPMSHKQCEKYNFCHKNDVRHYYSSQDYRPTLKCNFHDHSLHRKSCRVHNSHLPINIREHCKPCESNRNDICKHKSKYRSIGVNTTPQQITAACGIEFPQPDDIHTLPQNFTQAVNIGHSSLSHDVNLRKKEVKYRTEQAQFRNYHPKQRFTEYTNLDHPQSGFACDNPISLKTVNNSNKNLICSRLQATSAMMDANSTEIKQKCQAIQKPRTKARNHRTNRTLPKSWKHSVWLKEDDLKSSFADDEKSELNSSCGTNYKVTKQTSL